MLKPVQAKEIPTEQAIFTEAWNMLKKYHDIKAAGHDAEWIEVAQKANDIYKSGKGNAATEALSKGISLAVLNYLDVLSRKKN